MKLLALDTSSLACTVGVRNGNQIVVRYEEKAREHTRLLLAMIRDALQCAHVELGDLDAIVLGNGPGSFVGMRIAASVAQGLAFGAGLNIVPVSSMAAVAAEAGEDKTETVVVAQDAHMNEAYLGIYRVEEGGIPSAVVPERLQAQSAINEITNTPNIVAAGYGWQRFPNLLEANHSSIQRISYVLYPSATYLLKLGAAAYEQTGGIEPQDLVPAYLRQNVAEKPALQSTNF